jgi:hypothetical protein
MRTIITVLLALTAIASQASAQPLSPIRVSDDGQHFVRTTTGETFQVWGVNYDHDSSGRLLDEYWQEEWPTVVQDFKEIKALGANCVRVHLQFGLFMDSPQQANAAALKQLQKLLRLAEEVGLYLDITGLACYHKKNIPPWYDSLDEPQRWQAQAVFWSAVARTCQDSPAVFCYDLMNEPVLAGKEGETDWLLGELGGKFFVQRITLDLQQRTRQEVAQAWVKKLTRAIRAHDSEHLITVGVIPWVFAFGGGKPLFHSPTVGEPLDFVAVHFYPEAGKVAEAVKALRAYDVGKPLVIEEMFPLKCSSQELVDFVQQSAEFTDGCISFYWGQTAAQLRAVDSPTIGQAITANWLDDFQKLIQSRAP